MKIMNIFPTTVGAFELGREFNQQELEFLLSQPRSKNLGNERSVNSYLLNDPVLADLRSFVDRSVGEYFKTICAPKYDVQLKVTQSWLNYAKTGEHHHKHAHPNSYLSGVLYIKTDKENPDKITFFQNEHYNRISLFVENWNLTNAESWWFEVKAGELLIFPSELRHMVMPVEGEERVSLAFNTFPFGYIGDETNLTALRIQEVS